MRVEEAIQLHQARPASATVRISGIDMHWIEVHRILHLHLDSAVLTFLHGDQAVRILALGLQHVGDIDVGDEDNESNGLGHIQLIPLGNVLASPTICREESGNHRGNLTECLFLFIGHATGGLLPHQLMDLGELLPECQQCTIPCYRRWIDLQTRVDPETG